MIRIDRCVCFQRTFAELLGVARRTEARTIEDLQRWIPFGLRCRRCHPYVRRMLRTGETVFHEILSEGSEEEKPAPNA